MKPWEDFNLESLQSIYEGDLYHAVHNNRLDMTLPKILESDKKIHASELCTAAILTKWTSTIVQATLNELHPKFNACTWSPKPGLNKNRLPKSNPKKNMSPHAPPITPPRQTGALSLAIPSPPEEKKARKFDLRADAGTTLSCKENGDDCISSFIERMPKEYKPSLKFQSSTLAEFINDEGRWLEDEVPNSLMPICQTFSTCILKGCRYGCILTTSEAFIFRIGIPKGPHDTQVPNNITITMIEGGIMEYVSIPWNKASGNGLTYNLALWFLHVLAGNSNELASYPYDPLLKEELLNHKCNYTPNTPNSMDQPQRPRVTRECELSPCEIQAKRMVSTTVSVVRWSPTLEKELSNH